MGYVNVSDSQGIRVADDYFEGLNQRVKKLKQIWLNALATDDSSDDIAKFAQLIREEEVLSDSNGVGTIAELSREIQATMMALGRDSGEFSSAIEKHITVCLDQLQEKAASIANEASTIELEAAAAEQAHVLPSLANLYIYTGQDQHAHDNTRILAAMLRGLGFRVQTATRWLELSRLTRRQKPLAVVVLSGIHSDDEADFHDVGKNLRCYQDSLDDDVTCLLHCSTSNQAIRQLALDTGVDRLITGVLDFAAIASEIQTLYDLKTYSPYWAVVSAAENPVSYPNIESNVFSDIESCVTAIDKPRIVHDKRKIPSRYDGLLIEQVGSDLYDDNSYSNMLLQQSADVALLPKVVMASADMPLQNLQLPYFYQLPEGLDAQAIAQRLTAYTFEHRCLSSRIKLMDKLDADTQLIRAPYFISALESASDAGIIDDAALVYLNIEGWYGLVKDQTANTTSVLKRTIAKSLTRVLHNEDRIAVISDHEYVLLCSHFHATDYRNLVQSISERIGAKIDALKLTQAYTIRSGIALINSTNLNAILHGAMSAATLQESVQLHESAEAIQTRVSKQAIKTATARLKAAIEGNHLNLVYQPIVDMNGDLTERYEVLVRICEDQQRLSPKDFIPEGAPPNLARFIDRWVINEAISVLDRRSKEREQLMFFLKVSAESLSDSNFIPWLKKLFQRSEVSLVRCVFLVKQDVASRYMAEIQELESFLRSWNIALCIEDVGSERILNLLNVLRPAYLKLSKTIVSDSVRDLRVEAQLDGILFEAEARNIRVFASYVETTDGLSFGIQKGLSLFQGNFLQAPDEALEFDFSMTS